MKYLFRSLPLLTFVLAFAAGGSHESTWVDHDTVATALSKGGAIASGDDYRVAGARRVKAGQVEVHDKETDIFYIIDSEAELVTGGTMVGWKSAGNGQWLGTGIQERDTPLEQRRCDSHSGWNSPLFKEVRSINYYMVEVIKP